MKNTIDDMTDAELAGMVRRSVYAKNTQFGPDNSRFLLVLAVPYGDEDGVSSVAEALEGIKELMDRDTQVEIFDSAREKFTGTSLAEADLADADEEEKDDAATTAWLN